MNITDKKTWTRARLSVYWRADHHTESHSIEFQRPTDDNPSPRYPVVAGEELSTSRLSQSDSWGSLYSVINVEAFDEHSLTIRYGTEQYVLTPEGGSFSFGEKGMDYTTFEMHLRLLPDDEAPAFFVTHDERFLRRFRTKERVMQLTKDDLELLHEASDKRNPFAQYGWGRWLYYNLPEENSMREAERLFIESKNYVPDALASYALMWRYGETKEGFMDLKESDKLLKAALKRGSERAALQMARLRIFGMFCEAEPEAVAKEIEQRISSHTSDSSTQNDYDPQWHILLAYAYEQMDRRDDAIAQYELAISQGELDAYFYMACLYKERGNMALYDSLMEEGINHGSGFCCIYGADMSDEDYEQLPSNYQKRIKHEVIENRLDIGVKRGDGMCAYFLWLLTYNGSLGFNGNAKKWSAYLKQGVKMGDVNCIEQMAQLAEDGEWPEEMSSYDIAELWLRAARYLPTEENAIRALSRISDSAFLLRHKDEWQRYWLPRIKEVVGDTSAPSEPENTKKSNTPIEPRVIVIWPSGHMDVLKADVYKMKSYREMARELIDASGLDAVHYSPLLETISKEAQLDLPLVMYVDCDAQMKGLDDNAIGTQLYGTGDEVCGPIIICQEDKVHDCHSFKTLEDLVGTYTQINKHCGGLLIFKDDDDGRFDAWA